MFLPNWEAASLTFGRNAAISTALRAVNEACLLGYDGVHLLARRQSAVCETSQPNSIADEGAPGPVAYRRFHFWGSAGWGLPEAGCAAGGRSARAFAGGRW